MCFCKSVLLRGCLDHYKPLLQYPIHEHWITLNHWPIREQANSDELIMIAKEYGCLVFDQQHDRGLHKAFNNWLNSIAIEDDSIVLGLDTKSGVNTAGFDSAVIDVMQHDPTITICCVSNDDTKNRGWNSDASLVQTTTNGTRYFICPAIAMWVVGAMRVDWIKRIGGFTEPNEYYGNLEIALKRKPGFKLAYLLDYWQVPIPHPSERFDPRYQQWKHDHLRGFKRSFKEWLIEHNESLDR